MRPARKGPENLAARTEHLDAAVRFNEAGPQGAGKPIEFFAGGDLSARASMRPARKGPENPPVAPRHVGAPRPASMRPARKGPENRLPAGVVRMATRAASMRPARKGPENRTARRASAAEIVWLQ